MQVNFKEFYYFENVFHLLKCSNAVLQHLNILMRKRHKSTKEQLHCMECRNSVAIVVNHNMEYKIIIFSTSSLHQAEPVEVFPQEFEFVIQNLTPERRLWWPNILAGWREQVRVEATRDLPKFKTFSNNVV